MKRIFAIAALLLAVSMTCASASTVKLSSGPREMPVLDGRMLLDRLESCSGELALVMPKNRISAEDLRRSGAAIMGPVPGGAWLIRVPVNPANLARMVFSAVPWDLDMRMDPRLEGRSGVVRVVVSFAPDANALDLLESLQSAGLVVLSTRRYLSQCEGLISSEDVEELASIKDVVYIERASGPFIPMNDSVRSTIGANVVQGGDYGLQGDGITIGIWDAGRVDDHQDFEGRLGWQTDADVDHHSTHVAGTMAGNGAMSADEGGSERQWRGVAPKADIVSWGYIDPLNDFEVAVELGIDISQNSWGEEVSEAHGNCDDLGRYEGLARGYDHVVRGIAGAPVIVVFAAGNQRGAGQCGIDAIDGYDSLPPPASAKNVIVVGATNSTTDSMTGFSSWGPTDDGRVKPDIVAPGCDEDGKGYIQSTLPGDSYGGPGWCGTSMAAPVVSGSAAVILQRLGKNGETEAPPSLVKAVLVQTAVDRGVAGPDFRFGFGRINIWHAALLVKMNGYRTAELDAVDDEWREEFEISSNPAQIRVTLAWDDVGPAAGASGDIINDLDLVLIDPDGSEHLPLVADPDNPQNAAAEGRDDRNNVEQVVVENPMAGTWIVEVSAAELVEPQAFSIAGDVLGDAICDGDGDGYLAEGGPCGGNDCDDSEDTAYPGHREVCDDGIDNDCDGETDEDCDDVDPDDLFDDDGSNEEQNDNGICALSGVAATMLPAVLVLLGLGAALRRGSMG